MKPSQGKYPKFKVLALSLPFVLLLVWSISSSADEVEQKKESPSVEYRIEVMKVRLIGDGDLLEIRFRVHGVRRVSPSNPRYIYIIKESTGEIFYPHRVSRVGALGQKNLNEGPISFVIIDNIKGKIIKGNQVTLGIGQLRQEHILVEK